MTDDRTRLAQALTTIVTLWPAMYPEGPRAIAHGTIGRTSNKPLPVPVPTLRGPDGSPGAQVSDVVASWGLVVADDLDLHPTIRCRSPRWHRHLTPLPEGHHGPRVLVSRTVCACGIAPGSTNLEHRMPATDTVAVARFLRVHADYLAGNPDAVDELAEAADVVRRIAEPAGAREFVGRCECGGDLRALHRGPARCSDCGQVADADALRERLTAEAEDRLMTAADIVRLAPRMWDAPLSTMRIPRWVKAGRLLPHNVNGQSLYRVGDVAELLAQDSERKAG